MLFRLIATEDLTKDDIKKLEANGFKIEFKKTGEQKECYCNTSYRIIEIYHLIIDILTIEDLILISSLLGHELIITKNNDSKGYNRLEVYNGYRE